MKTKAPSLMKRFAAARPMPVAPPVITATFPSSFPIITPFGRCVEFGRPSKVVHRASTGRAKLYSLGHNFAILETASKEQIPLAVDENCSGVLTFCLFVQKRG